MTEYVSKPEKLIDQLTPAIVYYTGAQGFYRVLPNGKKSNPDFVVDPELDDDDTVVESKYRKVIFHHGLIFHHDELHNRGQDLINAWEEIGYGCLIIWEDELKNLDQSMARVAEFIGWEAWESRVMADEDNVENYVGLLEQYCAIQRLDLPEYKEPVQEDGPPHAPRWTMSVKFEGTTYTTPPIQGSKQEAKQMAAKQILKSIKLEVLERADSNTDNAIDDTENKGRRVEYQKFLRIKLEQPRFRGLYGLTENIVLVGEEDIVLQREFRIDFLLQKIDAEIPLSGLFWYFRKYNIFEFKSVNDLFTPVHLAKYIGQTFWWIYAKRQETQNDKSGDIVDILPDEVTLTIITVRYPRNVLAELDRSLGDSLLKHGDGHYQWDMMGVSVNILAINEFPVERERYAWLAFVDAQSKKYQEYIEKLASDITKSEEYQDYFDIINELEKEGREEMAYEIMNKYIRELPFEKQMKLINSVIPSDRQKDATDSLLSRMSLDLQQDTIISALGQMSKEQRRKILERFQ